LEPKRLPRSLEDYPTRLDLNGSTFLIRMPQKSQLIADEAEAEEEKFQSSMLQSEPFLMPTAETRTRRSHAIITSAYRKMRSLLRAAPATPLPPQTIDWVPTLIAALAICGVLSGISLLVPPFIDWDSANGFLAWRGTLRGAVNSGITPDYANIARDTTSFLTAWSPGQYLVPGAISLLGVPLGVAMTLTVALGLVASLLGWVMVVRAFAPRTSLGILIVMLVGLFHYSTHSFSTYHGGEILLQAATPWLVLAGCRVPEMDAIPAAVLAAGVVFLAFMAKLTGLIVGAAALVAGSWMFLTLSRRITRGMIGGAFGALGTLALLYVAFLWRGGNPSASVAPWSLPFRDIAFACLVPWVAGISWSDPIGLIFFRNGFSYVPTAFLALILPFATLVIGLVLFWRPRTTSEKKLKLFSMFFYGIVTVVFILLYMHGSAISFEERHFRSVGTLLFVCALTSALTGQLPRWSRGLFLALSVLMALYGVASFSYHEFTTARGRSLDRSSWTNQRIYDAAALDFTREVYAHERRAAVFVLPSYQLAVTLPVDARILVIDLNYEGDQLRLTRGYAGRVPGHLVVLMPNREAETSWSNKLLSSFTDYPRNSWESKSFANITVFSQ